MRINIRFAGAGGQGVILASVLLAKGYGLGEDYHVSQTQSYGPEARGGACKAEVVISDEEIDYMKVDDADVFIAMNQAGFDKYIDKTKDDAIVLINSTLVDPGDHDCVKIAATDMAEDMGADMAVNMVMLGALTKLLPTIHFGTIVDTIKRNLAADLAEADIKAFTDGYDTMEKEMGDEKKNS